MISLIFSAGISTYFYSYFKWVNPTFLIEKKEALEKYGSEGSGKNLPFSSLSEDLKKKEEKE